jgi:hypothetical protein
VTCGNRHHQSLHEKVDELSQSQADVVWNFVNAVLTPIHSDEVPTTWLNSNAWTEAFTTWLQGYHALSAEPLGRLQFEAAFNRACEAAGWQVEPASSAVQRFYDTTISDTAGNKKRLSLKASSAEDMKPNKVHISKLTEGAWIQDARQQVVRRSRLEQLFQEYQSSTSSIFILRGFKETGDFQVLYELVEVPTSIFGEVSKLSVAQSQPGTINIPAGTTPRTREFAIRIDRSDAKITLTGIRLEVCTVHGRWGMPHPVP